VSETFGTLSPRSDHPASPEQLTRYGPLVTVIRPQGSIKNCGWRSRLSGDSVLRLAVFGLHLAQRGLSRASPDPCRHQGTLVWPYRFGHPPSSTRRLIIIVDPGVFQEASGLRSLASRRTGLGLHLRDQATNLYPCFPLPQAAPLCSTLAPLRPERANSFAGWQDYASSGFLSLWRRPRRSPVYPGLPHPAPSALGLSQPHDGLLLRTASLSSFIQAPPLGFKEHEQRGLPCGPEQSIRRRTSPGFTRIRVLQQHSAARDGLSTRTGWLTLPDFLGSTHRAGLTLTSCPASKARGRRSPRHVREPQSPRPFRSPDIAPV